MQVCVSYEHGLFLRINTRDVIRPCVAISAADNPFLDHDSHIDCSISEIDEFEIEESLGRDGIIGYVDVKCADEVLSKLVTRPYINEADKEILRKSFAEALD